MKILLLGYKGLVGNYILKEARNYNVQVVVTSSIDHNDNLEGVDCIVNCAAYTNVANALNEPDKCFNSNVSLVNKLALISKSKNIPLIHLSTIYIDCYYVWSFSSDFDYYTYTKLMSEHVVENINPSRYDIFRTGVLFGKDSDGIDKKIIGKVIPLLKANKDVVLNNKPYSKIMPTYAKHLAISILEHVNKNVYTNDIIYATNRIDLEDDGDYYDYAPSWHDYVFEAKQILNSSSNIIISGSSDIDMFVPSRGSKWIISKHWKAALREYIESEWK